MGSDGRITIPPGDPSREYSPEEQERLTHNLQALLKGIHSAVFSSYPIDSRMLEVLHRNVFDGVRLHAGRFRRPGYGSERLTFGPHRSCHRDEVPELLEAVFTPFQLELMKIEANPELPGYDVAAIEMAARLHADVIRIHPFEDGNGRAGRALMNVVLVRLGLFPIPLEAPKQEYLACLNEYYRTGDIRMLVALAIDLYPVE